MKRFFVFSALALMAVAALFSCAPSPEKVSAGDIVAQFNKSLKDQAVNQKFVTIQVGKYELNSDAQRLVLRQLQAAGLVTYAVDRYPWWEKSLKHVKQSYTVSHYYWGYDYPETKYRWVTKNVYNFEDHYIVTVGLTNKGKSLVVKNVPEPVEKVDPDLVQPEVDKSKYAWNKVDLTESWPEIHNPFLELGETQESNEPKASTRPSRSSGGSNDLDEGSEEPEDKTERIVEQRYRDYNSLNLFSETVVLKGYTVKAVKARNIQITQVDGRPVASAEVILKTSGVSDAARICNDVENGEKAALPVTLHFYLDKGWVLDTPSLEDADIDL